MCNSFERIKNFNVSVQEAGSKIIFLRKLMPGGSAHSFGIHVAKLAGMPKIVVQRANKIMHQLEQTHAVDEFGETAKTITQQDDMQLSFFQLEDPVLKQIRDEIRDLDIDTLTPVEALLKLNEIKKLTGQ